MTRKPPNSFVLLGEELLDRLLVPVGQVSFWGYLAMGVVAFGGLGVWVELYKIVNASPGASVDSLKIAVLEYAPTLVGSSAMQLVLAEGRLKFLRTFGYVVGIATLSTSWMVMVHQDAWSTGTVLVWGGLLCLVAISLWWIANGREAVFQDTPGPEASVGGDVGNPLSGDTTGFKV